MFTMYNDIDDGNFLFKLCHNGSILVAFVIKTLTRAYRKWISNENNVQ